MVSSPGSRRSGLEELLRNVEPQCQHFMCVYSELKELGTELERPVRFHFTVGEFMR